MNRKLVFYLYASCLVGVGLFLFVLYGATGHSFDFKDEESLKYFIFSVSFLTTSFLFLCSSLFMKWKLMYVITKIFLSVILCLLLFLVGVFINLSRKDGFVLPEAIIIIFLMSLIFGAVRYLLKKEFWN